MSRTSILMAYMLGVGDAISANKNISLIC
ncbi:MULTISPECIES: DUF5445 family protein [Escherichia]